MASQPKKTSKKTPFKKRGHNQAEGEPQNAPLQPPEGPGTVRIIGGKHRGRPLLYSGDIRTRPMKDRVREAVFNLVGPRAKGKVALDLFAGTGALGLEAISRGATAAVLVERHLPTSQLIQKNAESIGIQDAADVCFGDTFLWARRLVNQLAPGQNLAPPTPKQVLGKVRDATLRLTGEAPWLIFCSPPYDFFVTRLDEMLGLITSLWQVAPAESLLVVETDANYSADKIPLNGEWDVRTYYPAVVGIIEKPYPPEVPSELPQDSSTEVPQPETLP